MSTYGDRGNVICLQRRCQWRGIEVEIVPLKRETQIAEFERVDLIVGGGAQDRQQELVMRDLQGVKAETIGQMLEDGTPGVFTCGSPQLLGTLLRNQHWVKKIEGLGLLDMVSRHLGIEARRCIGNLVFENYCYPAGIRIRSNARREACSYWL